MCICMSLCLSVWITTKMMLGFVSDFPNQQAMALEPSDYILSATYRDGEEPLGISMYHLSWNLACYFLVEMWIF